MRVKTRFLTIVAVVGTAAAVVWAQASFREPAAKSLAPARAASKPPAGSELATFGAGCFWCTEAVFQQLKGVHSVVSGYSGGSLKNPTYEQVCRGDTGHAEVVQITFDPAVISFPELLEVFWQTHNPTTRDRQGHDRGSQYRSVILWHTDKQKDLAEEYKQKLNGSGAFPAPIVTEIVPYKEFYPAEVRHQNFYLDNPRQGYCERVIRPKLEEFEAVFKDKLKARP